MAGRVLRFPLVVEAQASTALDVDAVGGWREAAKAVSRPAPATVEPPPDAAASKGVEQVILSRGSTRLFRRQTAAAPLLEWGLSAASRAVPLDAAPAGTLLEHLVNVHDVADAEAGGYRYTATGGFEGRTRSDDPRAAGAHLCLDQPLGGDSAYTVFHAATLDPLLDALGGRGYRAAQLEAGIVAGRLALNAVALARRSDWADVLRRPRVPVLPQRRGADARHGGGDPRHHSCPQRDTGPTGRAAGYGRVMARVAGGLHRSSARDHPLET